MIVLISARLYDFWRYRRTRESAEASASWALRFTVGAAGEWLSVGLDRSGSIISLGPGPPTLTIG